MIARTLMALIRCVMPWECCGVPRNIWRVNLDEIIAASCVQSIQDLTADGREQPASPGEVVFPC